LKHSRDKVEFEAFETYAIPRTGVPKGSDVHMFGHGATKVIPSLAFSTWTALAILAADGGLPSSPSARFRLEVPAHVVGMRPSQPSPPFALGKADFEAEVTDCPSGVETAARAQAWIDSVVSAWLRRPEPSVGNVALVVGAVDRTPMGGLSVRQYGSDMGLARARAETVRQRLVEATKHLPARDRLDADRIVVHVNGPSFTSQAESARGGVPCQDPERAADRTVVVWMPAAQ
jgi:hypothetical protein